MDEAPHYWGEEFQADFRAKQEFFLSDFEIRSNAIILLACWFQRVPLCYRFIMDI
jgi:hypothetical protein